MQQLGYSYEKTKLPRLANTAVPERLKVRRTEIANTWFC